MEYLNEYLAKTHGPGLISKPLTIFLLVYADLNAKII